MPQSWEASWAAPVTGTLQDRAQRVQSLGNLTLLSAKLNAAVSNGPWNGKKAALKKHDLLILNRDLDSFSNDGWTDASITERTNALIKYVMDIWTVPSGYKSSTVRDVSLAVNSVDLSDLLSAN